LSRVGLEGEWEWGRLECCGFPMVEAVRTLRSFEWRREGRKEAPQEGRTVCWGWAEG
jgi:hypothetical protein